MALEKRWLMVSSIATFMRVMVLKECLLKAFSIVSTNRRRALRKGFITNGISSALKCMHEMSILPSMEATCTNPMRASHEQSFL